MLKHPASKYRPFAPVALSDRTWPDRILAQPPIWLSTDLRDGNQVLIEPMNLERKLRLFEILVAIGFEEIEVAFPSASQTDFDFVRYLIEHERIPADVTIGAEPRCADPSLRGAGPQPGQRCHGPSHHRDRHCRWRMASGSIPISSRPSCRRC